LTIESGERIVEYDYSTNYKFRNQIIHGDTNYSFTYDRYGNNVTTNVDSRTLATKTYLNNNGPLQKIDYGNGQSVGYIYDEYGNIMSAVHNNDTIVNNYSNSRGDIIRSVDKVNDLETRLNHDTTGRLISKDSYTTNPNVNGDTWRRSLEYNYDRNNNVTWLSFADYQGTINTIEYKYDDFNRLENVDLSSGKSLSLMYDDFNRQIGKSLDTATPIETNYTYIMSTRGGSYTTNYIDTEIHDGYAYSYYYDKNGNITAIQNGTKQSDESYEYSYLSGNKYVYDEYNQLVKDTDYDHGTVTDYDYDSNGNITQKSVTKGSNTTTTTYTYNDSQGWGDLLTAYEVSDGISSVAYDLVYDAIGNPITYRDGITMQWQSGRWLKQFKKDNTTINYTYDPNGLRTQKTVNVTDGGSTTATNVSYVYEGGKLLQMKYGSKFFDFFYDAYGTAIGFAYRSSLTSNPIYNYYGLNSRGDVEVLYNEAGTITALYEYDAYGKPISVKSSTGAIINSPTHIANLNPLRYRSYVYDTETGLYYLQSRYYDPTTCRFINADVFYETGQGINGYNMFAYCNNNPVMYSDPLGTLVTYSGVTYSGQEFHNVPAHQLGWYGQIKEYSIDSVVYDVPLYCQGDTKLCWAYSQTMIEDYNSGITKTQDEADQAAIALAIQQNGSDWNHSNWPTNCSGYSIDGTPYFTYFTGSINDLCNLLYKEGPIYAYYWNKKDELAHVVVVTGANAYTGVIYTNNPQGYCGSQTKIQFVEWYVGGPMDRSFGFHAFLY